MPPKKAPVAKKRKAPAAKKRTPATKKSPASGTAKKRPTPAAFKVKIKPDAILAAVVGASPDSRPQLTKKIWDYIKSHKLQDPNDGRYILPDDKLKALFGTSGKVFMTDIPKAIKNHTTV